MTHARRTAPTAWLMLASLLVAAGAAMAAEGPTAPGSVPQGAADATPARAAAPSGLAALWDGAVWLLALDETRVVLLAAALVVAALMVHRLRSRRALAVLSVFSLAYFGFFLGGCVCPIGSIQNVTAALADPGYVVPATVVAVFALPLVAALIWGRVFCGGVCPLGAIQDVVLLRPLRLPMWLQSALGYVPYVYLGAAVLFAATDSGFLICQYDPFVSFFRLDGSPGMFLWGGGLLVVAMFIGRPYCRFLCPYGALLALCSRVAWVRVKTTPDDCVNCRLCEKACPFGAIRAPTVEGGGPQ